jgi:predicted phosphodiesterase|tara:strand:+ start:523 stop:1281 length:759 start_codon:yes stop_codon:yes gene_type:complete
MRRAIIIPDQHFPLEDAKALDVMLQAIQVIKPNIAVNLGDVGEWESVSAWQWKRRKVPPLEYQLPAIDEEIREVNKGLDKIDKALDNVKCKTKYMLQGNHDEWLDRFVEKFPYLKEYTFRKACKIDERGYKYYPHNKPLKIGKINFIHGVYATVYHAKKHLEAYGSNICYGHTHDVQRHTLTKLDSGTIAAWAMGCLKDMSSEKNKWLRGRLHNWCHAFGIITWHNNGDFQVETIDIQKGKAFVWGKEIIGK